jgi:O-antigen/teichoic acid export membrane protein
MGIESAIAYALYKPIAEGDEGQQRAIIDLYRKLYIAVAAFIMVVGVMVIPFLGVIIKDADEIPDITLIYILYLVNSAISYLLVYKKTLLDAHQCKYIGVSARAVSWVLQDIAQIIILLTTRNFILYLCMYIVTTVVSNLYISWRANKEYPFLREKSKEPVNGETKKEIVKNIKAMFMHQFGNVIVNNTDNLLISFFVGIVAVGCSSNYSLVVGSVKQVLNEAVEGISASVGNLGVTSGKEHIKKVYKAVLLFNNWGFGLCAMCMYAVLSPFVELSFGKQFVFHYSIVFVMCLNFYIQGVEKASNIFHNSLGLFWYDRYKAVIEAVLNLGISVALAPHFGVLGILVGTTISSVLTTLWVEPFVIYRHRFFESSAGYFALMGLYVCQTALAWWVSNRAGIFMVSVTGVTTQIGIMIVKLVTVLVVADVVYLLLNAKNEDFKYLLNKFLSLVKERKRKNG